MKSPFLAFLSLSMMISPAALHGQAVEHVPFEPARQDNTFVASPARQEARQRMDLRKAQCRGSQADCARADAILFALLGAGQPAWGALSGARTDKEELARMAADAAALYQKHAGNALFRTLVVQTAPLFKELTPLGADTQAVFVRALQEELQGADRCADKAAAYSKDVQNICQNRLNALFGLYVYAPQKAAAPALQTALNAVQSNSPMAVGALNVSLGVLLGLGDKAALRQVLDEAARREDRLGAMEFLANFTLTQTTSNLRNVFTGKGDYLRGPVSRLGAYPAQERGVDYAANVWEDLGYLMASDPALAPVLERHVAENLRFYPVVSTFKNHTMNPLLVGALRVKSFRAPQDPALVQAAQKAGLTARELLLTAFYNANGLDPETQNRLNARIYAGLEGSLAAGLLPKPFLRAGKQAKQRYARWQYTRGAMNALDAGLMVYCGAGLLTSGAEIMGNVARLARAAGVRGVGTLGNVRYMPQVTARLKTLRSLKEMRLYGEYGKPGFTARNAGLAQVTDAQFGTDLSAVYRPKNVAGAVSAPVETPLFAPASARLEEAIRQGRVGYDSPDLKPSFGSKIWDDKLGRWIEAGDDWSYGGAPAEVLTPVRPVTSTPVRVDGRTQVAVAQRVGGVKVNVRPQTNLNGPVNRVTAQAAAEQPAVQKADLARLDQELNNARNGYVSAYLLEHKLQLSQEQQKELENLVAQGRAGQKKEAAPDVPVEWLDDESVLLARVKDEFLRSQSSVDYLELHAENPYLHDKFPIRSIRKQIAYIDEVLDDVEDYAVAVELEHMRNRLERERVAYNAANGLPDPKINLSIPEAKQIKMPLRGPDAFEKKLLDNEFAKAMRTGQPSQWLKEHKIWLKPSQRWQLHERMEQSAQQRELAARAGEAPEAPEVKKGYEQMDDRALQDLLRVHQSEVERALRENAVLILPRAIEAAQSYGAYKDAYSVLRGRGEKPKNEISSLQSTLNSASVLLPDGRETSLLAVASELPKYRAWQEKQQERYGVSDEAAGLLQYRTEEEFARELQKAKALYLPLSTALDRFNAGRISAAGLPTAQLDEAAKKLYALSDMAGADLQPYVKNEKYNEEFVRMASRVIPARESCRQQFKAQGKQMPKAAPAPKAQPAVQTTTQNAAALRAQVNPADLPKPVKYYNAYNYKKLLADPMSPQRMKELLKGKNILFFNDQPRFVQEAINALRAYGANVTLTATDEETVRYALENPVDLIYSDILKPFATDEEDYIYDLMVLSLRMKGGAAPVVGYSGVVVEDPKRLVSSLPRIDDKLALFTARFIEENPQLFK